MNTRILQSLKVMIPPEGLKRFEAFVEGMRKDVYCPMSIEYAKYNSEYSVRLFLAATRIEFKGMKILEVGIGDGHMMEYFRDQGAIPIGIGFDSTSNEECKAKGLDVHIMDQSFMTFPDESFDLLWSQQCLEHSIMPFYTLHEYRRVLKPGALAYIELPGSDNDNADKYTDDLNHYAVMSINMWLSLMRRAKFKVRDHTFLDLVPIDRQDMKRSKLKQYSIILKKEK